MSEYLYVCHFSNGHIKVGRSTHPKSRIAQHADRVACLGIELVEHHIAECVGRSAPAETALISICAELASKRNKSEWFEGLQFANVCGLANRVADTVFNEKAMETNKSPIERACEIVKTQAELARILGLSPAMVNQLVNGSRPVPIEHCLGIEVATAGQVTRQELRPHDFWKIWPDLAHLTPAEKATA